MRILRFQGEKSVASIADKAYQKLSASARKKAVTALLRANPQLASLGEVAPGSILTIPEVPGTRPAATRGPEDPGAEITAMLVTALRGYGARLETRHAELEEDLGTQLRLLKDRGFERVAALRDLAAKSIEGEGQAASQARARAKAAIERLAIELEAR